ncbi:MAG: chemotaxis protein CheA [Ignavibacteriae bacterium HGW-Ignavibacteriae-2]|nr:MAG: chemotaxis protein CheA [Ignavibacteriae bacterium HGW-Ignavibacteriae-2]
MLIDPEMVEIVDSFLIETNEILEKLNSDLILLETMSEDDELLNQVFRAFHTIKGTSGFLGLEKLTKVTHRCEDILNKLRKGEIKLNSTLMDMIFLSSDKIKELVDSIEKEKNENVEIESTLIALSNVLGNMTSEDGKQKDVFVKKIDHLDAESLSVENLNNLPDINLEQNFVIDDNTFEEDYDENLIDGNKESGVNTEALKKSENERTEARYLSSGKLKKEDANIRVEVERLDELLNIVSELVLGRNQLIQVNSRLALENEGSEMAHELSEATKQIDLMTNELQLVVMKTRMVKIGKVFNRFPRLVRDLSKELNKEVNLVIVGEDTELDKTLIEEINDPLVHLVRNSIDHGIEAAEIRKQQGKNDKGTLILSARHEGNNVFITVEDDGKGINPDIIKKKAIEKGIITEQKADELSLSDVYNLIFLPGFSTADSVTNVSGRGVGMDVVKTNVSKLRGIINVESSLGTGTKMIIKLPLTLAIISGMVVELSREQVIIPLSSVVEVLRVHTEDIYTINTKEVIKVRERVIPLVDIDQDIFGTVSSQKSNVFQFIVVVGVAEKQYGIKVNRMIGQQEVVIKSLGNYLKKVEGIAGSTIMGDGKVIMILDIAELLNSVRNNVQR